MAPADWEKAFRSVLADAEEGLRLCGSDPAALEAFRVEFLGRKGRLSGLLRDLKDLPIEDRKRLGPEANSLREQLDASVERVLASASAAAEDAALLAVADDLTLPARPLPRGRRHPLTVTQERMAAVLSRLGFSWAEGPMVETDFNNFEALNFPPDHPARDTQDTFFLERKEGQEPLLMRTHTSPVQIRALKGGTLPLRVMAPGRVFRHEALDATHSHVFHQVEGLYVDKNVSMADLKGTLETFMKELFGPGADIRFRPSYFPFVEPGAEVDMRCIFCGGTGTAKEGPCGVCKRSGYLEMGGAGLVHPNVLAACGHDPKRWKGYAFGMGVERIALMLFGVGDIRAFYENDVRLLAQFG